MRSRSRVLFWFRIERIKIVRSDEKREFKPDNPRDCCVFQVKVRRIASCVGIPVSFKNKEGAE